MRLYPHAVWEVSSNRLVLTTYNVWGGCRAGGFQTLLLKTRRPAESFTVEFREVQVESAQEYLQVLGKNTQ